MKPSPSKESLFSEEEETVVWNVDDDDNEAEAEVGLSLFARKRHKASIVQAVSDYDFSEGTESIELAGMDRIAEEVIEKLDAIYAGVNLFDSNGHLALSSRTRDLHDRSFPASTNRVHALPGDSICHSVILNESSDFVSQTMEKDSPSNPWQHEMLYVGHMIENHEGVRVGVVCACLDSEDEVMNENVGSILKKLSIDVMQQLDLRRILMERNISAIQSLQFQNHALARQLKDCCTGASCCKISTPSVVLPACGPLREITTFDVALQEDSPFLSTDLPRRTSTLPIFNGNSANEQEMSHLPDDYFAIADSMSVDRTPVQKNDMERVAAIESFELKEIPHDDATGIALTRTTVSRWC